MSITPPPLSPTQPSWAQFQVWWQLVLKQLNDQLTDLFAALSSMPDISDVHIAADYTGTPNAGQLPATVQAKRLSNETDVSAAATWSFVTDNGGITATIDSTGILTITAMTSTTTVTITSTYGGVDKSRSFAAFLDVADPPSSGTVSGSGTTATDSSLSNVTSASYAAVSNELLVTIGSAGNVNLSATLAVSTAASSPAGTYQVVGIWRHWNGASWADVGSSANSSPDCVVSTAGAKFTVTKGSLKIARSVTGLTPGATEKYQLYVKNASGTRTMTLSGTASAVGS